MSKIFFIRCITFSLSHFPMSNKFCGSDNGVENYLSNIICWQTCQTLLSICRKHSVAHHKACRTFSVEHFDVENLPWSMGKCIVEHFLSKIVCFPVGMFLLQLSIVPILFTYLLVGARQQVMPSYIQNLAGNPLIFPF